LVFCVVAAAAATCAIIVVIFSLRTCLFIRRISLSNVYLLFRTTQLLQTYTYLELKIYGVSNNSAKNY